MGDTEILRSNQEGFKALPRHAPRILLVDEDAQFRAVLAGLGSVTAVASIQEAELAADARQFDLLLYGNFDWEAGLLFYLDLLNRRRSPCQFILFIGEHATIPPQLRGLVRVMRKSELSPSLDFLGI